MYPVIKEYIKFKLQPTITTVLVEDKNLFGASDINKTAQDILFMCNGINTKEDIKISLVKKYNEDYKKVSKFIDEFIKDSYDSGVIDIKETKYDNPINIKIYGSESYWTPKIVSIELTHKCPLKCKHCYVDAGEGKSIDYNLLEKICKEVIELGIERIQLTGGEPLVYDKIDEIINFICDHNLELDLYTSGVVSSKNIYDTIEKIKNIKGTIQVSIDGLKSTHDEIRGVNGSFDKSIEFIRKSSELGVNTTVATCIIDQELEEIEELVKILKSIGVKRFRLGNISEQGRAKDNVVATKFEKQQKINTWKKYLAKKYNDSSFFVEFVDEKIIEAFQLDNRSCGMGYDMVKISPDGLIYPCILSESPVGDIKNRGLKDFIINKSSVFTDLKKPGKEFCSECEYESTCNGCIVQGMMKFKDAKLCKWYDSQKHIIDRFER